MVFATYFGMFLGIVESWLLKKLFMMMMIASVLVRYLTLHIIVDIYDDIFLALVLFGWNDSWLYIENYVYTQHFNYYDGIHGL